jgi:haloacetate dehalogenase
VPTGHYPAEQRPDLILAAFGAFFAGEEPKETPA